MLTGAIIASGGGLVVVVVVIVFAMTLTRRHRLDQSRQAGPVSAESAEQAEALRSVQEQIERGSRLL